MARGRPRKAGKRTKGGRLKARTPDRIDPTPEMARRKKAHPGDLSDPTLRLDLTDPQRDALNEFFKLASKAGWGVHIGSSAITDRIGGGDAPDPDMDEARDLEREARYQAAQSALMMAGQNIHRTVCNLRCFKHEWTGSLADLRTGANALMDYFHIKAERSAA